MTRRTVLSGLAAAAAAQAQQRPRPVEWKPRLGILGPFTEANVRFASEEGFTNMILAARANPPWTRTWSPMPSSIP